jgi:opacity protein-like surface antigen
MTNNKTLAYLLMLPAMSFSLAASATQFDQPGDGPFFGEEANGQWLIGAKYVTMYNDDVGVGDASARNAGLLVGYEFARPVWKGKAAFEFQWLPSTRWGDIQPFDASAPSEYYYGGRYENPIYSGYFAYRSPGKLYFKGKVGLVASRFKIEYPEVVYDDVIEQQPVLDGNDQPVLDPDTMEPVTEPVVVGQTNPQQTGKTITKQENKTQVGYGLGLGYHIGKNFDLEIEYEGNQGKSQLWNWGVNAIVKLP